MDKYRFEYKESIRVNEKEIINLVEYGVYSNLENQERFILLKFHCGQAIRFYLSKFEINQYDKENKLISSEIYDQKNLDFQQFKTIVPMRKFKISPDCTQINTRLIKASVVNKTWQNGEWCHSTLLANDVSEEKILITSSSKFEFQMLYSLIYICILMVILLVYYLLILSKV